MADYHKLQAAEALRVRKMIGSFDECLRQAEDARIEIGEIGDGRFETRLNEEQMFRLWGMIQQHQQRCKRAYDEYRESIIESAFA